MNKGKSHTPAVVIMFSLFFIISFVTGLQNPMGVIVKDQFGTSNFLSQLGNLAVFIAYAFMGVPAGMMLKRYGYKATSLAAVIVGFTGVTVMWISGRAESYGIYLAGAFISGFSMCMLNTVVNPMLKSLGANEKKGNQLIQFGGAVNSVGATIAPVLVGYLMGNALRTISSANPALYIAMGIFAAAFVVLFTAEIPEPHIVRDKNTVKERRSAMSFPHFVRGIIAIFIYVGVEVGIPNISNLYMTNSLGIDAAVAGTIVGTYWLLMFAGRFIGGAVGGKVSPKAMLSFAACLALILVTAAIFTFNSGIVVNMPVFRSDASFGLEQIPVSMMFLILCGLSTSVMWGSTFSLAVSGLGKYTAAASGIFMVMVCGGGILPAIQAWIADTAGFAASFWLVIAGFAYILFYALIGSKKRNTNG